MGNTIVLFGSTQVGKSTLAGYLSSYNKPNDDFNRDMQRFKDKAEKMGIYEPLFLKNAWISCFTSMDYDELIRPNDGRSTTKRSHSTKALVPLSQDRAPLIANIVDTIGFSIEKLNDYQDLFQASAGLVLITYSQAKAIVEQESKKDLQKLLQPLSFWCTFKPSSNIAVVISQTKCFETVVENLNYSQEDLIEVNRVIEKIKTILPNQEIPIVPISVQTEYRDGIFWRKGHNVTKKIHGVKSYCLFDVLQKFNLSDDLDLGEREILALARPTRLFHQYSAMRVNVITGRLQIGDVALIGPVIYDDHLITVRGKISDMRNDQYKDDPVRWRCSVLSKGWVGGLKFENLWDVESEKEIREGINEIKLTDTTMIFGCGADSYSSINNCLWINVKLKDTNDLFAKLLDAMLPKENVRLYYYGKPIVMSVLEKSCLNTNEYLLKLIRIDPNREVGFFYPPRAARTQIQLPLLVRNGILIDMGSDKFYYSSATCTIQQTENIQSDIEYKLVVNVPKNDLRPDDSLFNATWCMDEREDNTKIIFTGLTLENLGERMKQIREYLDAWYVSKCNFKIYKAI